MAKKPDESMSQGALAALILSRFRLEPRCTWQGQYSWLVAYDKHTREYVKQPESTRAYRRFTNSDEAFEALIKLL